VQGPLVTAQLAIVVFDGFAFGMLLFVLSVGLSVTLGLMNFINLAHGAFGMLGGYIAVTVMRQLGFPFLLALPAAFLGAALVSVLFERTLFRRLYRAGELNQVLFTIGLVFVAAASAAYVFGTSQQPIQLPGWLRGSVEFAGVRFGIYRIFLIVVALLITGLLVFGLERTRIGAQVRASVDNQRVAQGLGLDVEKIFAVTFALGSGLAGLGGALAIEIVGLDPSFGFHYLVYVLIVVSVGGLSSITGSFVGAATLGICDVAGKYFVPQIGSFLIYLLLVAILFVRPLGLFGKR
jgi:branched-chain amino acid transport system permease protein